MLRGLQLLVRTVLCGSVLVGIGSLENANAVTYSHNRIAITADGNYNDRDDWGAAPMELALLAKRDLQSELVHYDWANIIGPNNPKFYDEMKASISGATRRLGFKNSRFFDCINDLESAINNLQEEIDASTSSDPLFIIAIGPMEVLWRAVNASDPDKRQYATVISHTKWNSNTTYPPTMTHTRADVEALGVKWIQIKDQNVGLYSKHSNGSNDWSPWLWLRDAPLSRMRWIYSRMRTSGKPDVSDAGVVYYLLTNRQDATPSKPNFPGQ